MNYCNICDNKKVYHLFFQLYTEIGDSRLAFFQLVLKTVLTFLINESKKSPLGELVGFAIQTLSDLILKLHKH